MPSSKPNTVIIVTPGFPKDEQDTTCLPAFQQFALALKQNFSELTFVLISLQYPFKKGWYMWNGIAVHAIGGKNKKHIFGLNTKRLAMQKLNELKEIYTIKGLISLWCIDTALVANKFALRNNFKHLIWIIGQDAKPTNGFVKKIKPKPEQLIAMSDFLQEEFKKNHQIEPQHVITNGINPKMFEPLNVRERSIDILGAGSLIPLKNYNLFIEVIAEVVKQYPSLTVNIAGDGPEKNSLIDLIIQYKLQNNIELIGVKTHLETLSLMNQSKLFLHTSHYEGNSTVLMEALYSGCRVISTQKLSNDSVKNLHVKSIKTDLVNCILELLSKKNEPERVTFNTMDDSAKKIMQLLLS
ncbi:MAG: glycosyltransferase family 4 protein [Burkholderiales bacterium]|nr:glycosyltransferase family 4 protein [Bacteroidia bacterium]